MPIMKKRLTQSEEFEIMKLVLDKFLWIGAIIMLYGLYMIFTQSFSTGIMWMIIGAIVLVILMVLIVKEYEVIS
ncbi:MAG: hypothetical protein QF824_00720 [Candidatus Woesearchaeota archaeon]|nr:hypothetical protein [Candidatus Woesearchaeota archaeon]